MPSRRMSLLHVHQGMPNQTGFGPLNGYYIGCCNTLPNDGFWAARMHWIWCRDSSNGRNSAGGNAAGLEYSASRDSKPQLDHGGP